MAEISVQTSQGDGSFVAQSQDSLNENDRVELNAQVNQTLPVSILSPKFTTKEEPLGLPDAYGKEQAKFIQVMREELTLYASCDHLLLEGESRDLEKAEEILRSILIDPYSFLEPPIVGTPDQLRAVGHLKLAQCLFRQYCSPDAPNPQPERKHEVLEAYKAAAAATLRFPFPRKNIFGIIFTAYRAIIGDEAKIGSIIEDYRPLVGLQRQALELYEEEMKIIQEPIAQKNFAILQLLSLYNTYCSNAVIEVEFHFQQEQSSQALDSIRKLIDECHVHVSSYYDKREQILCQLHLLHHLARVLMEGTRLECAAAILGPFVSLCIKEMHDFLQEADTDGRLRGYRREPAVRYQECMWGLVKGLEDVQEVLDDLNESMLIDELIDISRHLARLPKNLKDVEALCVPAIHQFGDQAVESLRLKALEQTSHLEAIRLNTDALKIAYMRYQDFQQTEDNPAQVYAFTFPPYGDLLLPDRWPPVEFSPDQRPGLAVDILTHLSMSRRALFAEASKKYDKMTDDEALIMIREADLNIHLCRQLLNQADHNTTGHWRNQVGMANLLKLIALRKAKSSRERIEEMERTIKEARKILANPVDKKLEDIAVEKRRLHILHLLDQQCKSGFSETDEELERQRRVCAESSDMWGPLLFADTSGNKQEQIREYRDMLANIEAHLPQSPSGTAEEYTVHGYSNFAMLLSFKFQETRSSGDENLELAKEATEAWTKATKGLELHFPGFVSWRASMFQLFARHLIVCHEYKRAIEMATEAVNLRRNMLDVDFAMAYKTGEDYRMDQIMMVEALEQLGRFSCAAQERENAIVAIEDILFIIHDLENRGFGDRALKLKRARILAFKSEVMAESGRKIESLHPLNESALIWKAVGHEIRSINPDIHWREMVYYEETYGSLMLNLINMCTELRFASYNNQSREDMAQEAANALRSASGMQSGGSFEKLPYALDSHVLFKYADAVSWISIFADLPSNAMALAESAMLTYLFALLAYKSSLGPLAFVSYWELILALDWTSMDLSLFPETACGMVGDCAKRRVDHLEWAAEAGQIDTIFEKELMVAEKEVELCRFVDEELLKKIDPSLRSEEGDERNRVVHERLVCKLAVMRHLLSMKMEETR